MVLWGGLRPIASQIIIDTATLVAWGYGALTQHEASSPLAAQTFCWILFSCVLTVYAAENLTNRWTLTFPMMPYLVLQGIRRLLPRKNRWQDYLHGLLLFLSFVCILIAGMLCVLFPALELPLMDGPYNVGKVDFFLPLTESMTVNGQQEPRAVWVRLLYPTLDPPQSRPYLTPATAADYCFHSMRFGAPPPLKNLDWLLHTWRLTERLEREGASLLDTVHPLPTVVYSHGLGGHADIYSYQTHALAAHGNIVLSISHGDGTSPAITQPGQTKLYYDYSPQLHEKTHGYDMDVILMRRNQTELRVQEILSVTRALERWNKYDIWEDLPHMTNLSLKGRLDLEHLTWMGHSFGGASVLTAAHRYPDLVHTVITHEPALDWAHPAPVSSLFATSRIQGLNFATEYNTTRFGNQTEDDSIHFSADILLLFSHEWVRRGWVMIPLIQEMQERGRLGSNETFLMFDYVQEMHHNEFSDLGMLTPVWLSRQIGLIGQRNPIETAKEVAKRTRLFLHRSRQRSKLAH